MSASTPFTVPRRTDRPAYFGRLQPRLAAAGLGALGLAVAGAIGLALVSQARPATDQSTMPARAAAVTDAALPARLSPWRDAWYLDDQVTSAAPASSRTALDLALRAHDDWALSGPAGGPLDLSIRAHDEWALSAAAAPPLDLSGRSHDDWPLESPMATASRRP